LLGTPLRWWRPLGALGAVGDCWFCPSAAGVLMWTGGSVVTEIRLLEP